MIAKHHNYDYNDGVDPASFPVHAGDRYYAQDAVRDFWYLMDRSGLTAKDILGNKNKIIVYGGKITAAANNTVTITELVCYVPKSVVVPNSFAATPPSASEQNIEYVRCVVPAGVHAISDDFWPGNVNLIVSYNESDGASRNRAKAAGSYVYDKSPSYLIDVDTSVASDNICLGTLSSVDGGVTITYTYGERTECLNVMNASTNGLSIQTCVDTVGANGGGIVVVAKGDYSEQVDLSGWNNITLIGCQGASIYRKDNSSYAIKSINSGGNEKKGIRVIGLSFYGNSKTGNYELLNFQYTDEFAIVNCVFDGNASSSATYKNFLVENCDKGYLSGNLSLSSGSPVETLHGIISCTYIPKRYRVQIFTEDGTWIKPALVDKATVTIIGAGGDGGNGNAVDANGGSGGGGGGAGSLRKSTIPVSGNVAVVVGQSAGANTSFDGAVFEASGGNNGSNASGMTGGAGANGGGYGQGGGGGGGGYKSGTGGGGGAYGSSGGVGTTGGDGGAGGAAGTAPGTGGYGMYQGGTGSGIGGGGAGAAGYGNRGGNGGLGSVSGGGSVGQDGQGYGAGGGGGGGGNTGAALGGAGAPGLCIVEWDEFKI